MIPVGVVFVLAGLVVNRGVDWIRNAFDKNDRVPKHAWILAAWGIGVGLAALACNIQPAVAYLKLPQDASCTDFVLIGIGFGSVAGFWHEILSRLSGAAAATPKGLLPES